MKKLLISLIIIVGVGTGIGIGLNTNHHANLKANSPAQVLSEKTKQVTGEVTGKKAEFGTPTTLKIPNIQVNAAVESVGLDKNHAMDVPKKAEDVGWYSLGGKPGSDRNTVLAGHYDRVDGSGAVFWDLHKVEKGDKVTLADENGKELTYEVTDSVSYPYDAFPLEKVFGVSNESMLIMYTCQGKWDAKAKNYSNRLVVYAKPV